MADFAADSASHDITGLLLAWRAGDRAALEALIPLVYEELRQIAHRQLAGERQQTLQTIDLVHEAYVRLVDASRVRWQNRAHFLAVAARSMRRILVDAARTRGAQKRGGDQSRVEFEPDLVAALAPGIDVIALDEALSELAEADPRRGQVVGWVLRWPHGRGDRAGARRRTGDRHAGLEGRARLASRAADVGSIASVVTPTLSTASRTIPAFTATASRSRSRPRFHGGGKHAIAGRSALNQLGPGCRRKAG